MDDAYAWGYNIPWGDTAFTSESGMWDTIFTGMQDSLWQNSQYLTGAFNIERYFVLHFGCLAHTDK